MAFSLSLLTGRSLQESLGALVVAEATELQILSGFRLQGRVRPQIFFLSLKLGLRPAWGFLR